MNIERKKILQLDLAFCVDLTNSMTPFIEAAKERLRDILAAVVEQSGLDLRVGIVGYRDYGTIELLKIHPFRASASSVQALLGKLKVRSPIENTDAAEAVFAGLLAAVDLTWRARATRVVVLVGDAPPHGCETRFGRFPDRFVEDPTGASLLEVGARLEAANITLHALGMVPSLTPAYDATVERTFGRLARTTGGRYFNARDGKAAMTVVEAISNKVARQIGLEQHLMLALADRQSDAARSLRGSVEAHIDELQAELETSPDEIFAALARLERRGIATSFPRSQE